MQSVLNPTLDDQADREVPDAKTGRVQII
jgi:hypothetical protein